MNSTAAGREAEAVAEKFLKARGYRLVQRNFSARTGEIDLIMSKDSMLTFVEVRYRSNPKFGTGADSVTSSKQRKIINTARMFLQKNGHRWNQYRFDVVSIGNTIDWIPGAFTLD